MSEDEYKHLLVELKQKEHFGFVLEAADGRTVPLLKNNGYLVAIAAYADDVPPVRAKLTINARDRIELFLEPDQ